MSLHLLYGELLVCLDPNLASLLQRLLLDERDLERNQLEKSPYEATWQGILDPFGVAGLVTHHLVHLAEHFFIIQGARSHDCGV